MVVMTDDKLFRRFGSLVVDVTDAVFVAVDDALKVVAVVLMVMRARAPTLIVPMLQVTVPAACAQVPCVVETETKVTCAGSGSRTETPSATPGPLFVTCSV